MNYYNVPSDEILSIFNDLIEKRLSNIPIAYLRGNQEFWSMNFKVNHSTLIPRPDSEILVASVIKYNTKQKGKIIDLGTGSGCLLLSILSELRDFTGIGVDKSAQAIEIAKLNAQELKLDKPIHGNHKLEQIVVGKIKVLNGKIYYGFFDPNIIVL
jgi:release factor glutamine methyltransferase